MKADFIHILNELKMNSGLMEEINLETMLTLLKNYCIITDYEEYILHRKGPVGRYELVGTILPNKVDEHMELFIKSLKIAGFTQSYEFVLTRVKNIGASGAGVVAAGAGVAPRGVAPVNVTSSDTRMTGEATLMEEAQEYLSRYIILNIDFMEFWSNKLLVSNTWSAFVDVQILEDFQDDTGKVVPSGDYVQVFGNVSKTSDTQILIQGDPGCGKSTYVDKIAIDWANKHEYLRDKFKLVFLISLQTLEVGIEQAIRNLLPKPSIKFVEDYYKHPNSKVLLILDGFDGFSEDSKFYSEVMRILNGQMSQFQFFTIVITTRRSHVDKIPQRYHGRSLLVKGFNEKSMKQFLQIQIVPLPDEQTDPNLLILLQNPFFCAIYCSLHFFGVDKSKLKDPYDFVKALVENAVKIEKETKGITNEEKQLQLLGAFAFQKLSSETLNVIDKLFSQKVTFVTRMLKFLKKKPVETIDMDQIRLGLLIKKKIPSVGGGYKQEFGFSHQLIAEYLAARYFVQNCLTDSQLKQLRADKLADDWEHSQVLHALTLSSPSSLQFVRFLLFEYLNNQVIEENQNFYKGLIEFYANVPQTRGVLKNLIVETVDVAPSMLNFDMHKIYRNFSRPKGLALIINNKKFDSGAGALPERIGTDVDAENLNILLDKLGYKVEIKENQTTSDIRSAMDRFSKMKEHENCDSAIVVILTHGSHGALYGSDNKPIKVDEFVGYLNSANCLALLNKPKIFIIQACRGKRMDDGLVSRDGGESSQQTVEEDIRDWDEADALSMTKVPLEADTLLAFATTPGYVSWRNSVHGSWFIQGVCEVFGRNAKEEEILHLFTEVNNFVSKKFTKCGRVQIPAPCSHLRKKFYFYPGFYYDNI